MVGGVPPTSRRPSTCGRRRARPAHLAPAPRAGATGRGNEAFTAGGLQWSSQELGELLGWLLPVESFAWSVVERGGGGVELFLAVSGEVGSLGEVLAEQPVGVLVAASLPGAVRVAEIHVDVGVDGEGQVLGHLFA